MNGATSTGNGNAQVGVYTAAGSQLVECTATTTAGLSSIQTIDITDTTFGPGLFYMAFRASSTTDRFFSNGFAAGNLEACGILEQTSQTDLPGTATFAVPATAYLPLFYVACHTLL